VPGDAEFQHRVLTAALKLLEESGAPVFQSYEEDAPDQVEGEQSWACPVSFPQPTADSSIASQVLDEMALLQPWYDKGRQSGGTSVGLSGLELEDAVRFVASFLEDGPPDSGTVEEKPVADLLKYAVEDIKAFYNEAAVSQPGSASIRAIEDWYWGETSAGGLVRAVRQACLEHTDPAVRIAASFLLVPTSQTFRDSDERAAS
jgi:hypothetical protein